MTDYEKREFVVRLADSEERTVTGIAAPYGQTIDIGGGYKERFERGAFDDAEGVKLFYGHREPIGKVTRAYNTDEGYVIDAVISKTQRGDEVYTLLKDGVLDRFSVGFAPVKDRMEGKTVVREKVYLGEVSVVAFPAYSQAKVSEVRSEEITNTKEDINLSNENENVDVTDLRDSVADLERRFAVLASGNEKSEDSVPVFRSGGEYLKALANGDEGARNLLRAYTGSTTADSPSRNGWVDKTLKLVEENRNVLNLFSKDVLPRTGNNIEYPKVASTTGSVGVQAAEGDNLTFMKVSTTTATAPVKTYGGYSELSRQEIERSELPILNKTLEFQALQYAKQTNAGVRAALVAGSGYNVPTGLTLATAKGKDFVGMVLDSVAAIEDNSYGLTGDFILVSRDVYKALVTLADTTDRPVFNVNGDGSNTFGNANIKGLTGSLAGLPVLQDPGLAAKQFYVASAQAITTYESAGAPVRLDDENVINLSQQFSLYGYMAVAIHDAKGVAKPVIA